LRDITQLRFRLVRLFQERLGSSRAGMDQLSFRKVEKKKHQVKWKKEKERGEIGMMMEA
jgi:hypothetical protein